jgi:hypothetical protein
MAPGNDQLALFFRLASKVRVALYQHRPPAAKVVSQILESRTKQSGIFAAGEAKWLVVAGW